MAGGTEIFCFECGADVFRDGEGCFVAQSAFNLLCGIFVSGVNDGELIARAKSRFGVGCRDKFGQFDNVRNGAAICAARKEHHIGAQLANAFDFFMRESPIVRRENVHDNCTCAERATLRAFAGHGLNDAADHHLQAAACAAGGNVDVNSAMIFCGCDDGFAVENLPAGEFFDFLNSIEYAARDVFIGGFNCSGGFTPIGLAIDIVLFFNQDGFGRGAAAIGGDDDIEFIHGFCFPGLQCGE